MREPEENGISECMLFYLQQLQLAVVAMTAVRLLPAAAAAAAAAATTDENQVQSLKYTNAYTRALALAIKTHTTLNGR